MMLRFVIKQFHTLIHTHTHSFFRQVTSIQIGLLLVQLMTTSVNVYIVINCMQIRHCSSICYVSLASDGGNAFYE